MRLAYKVLIIVVVLCAVSVLSATLALFLTMPDRQTTVINDSICLPAERGSISCGKTTNMLHNYLKKALTKEYNKVKQEDTMRQQKYLDDNKYRLMAIYDKHHWKMKPAAKLTGKEQPNHRINDSNAEMIPVRVWCHGRELNDTSGFLRHGVRYRNGRLVIPVSGTYFMYAYVDLFEPCDPSSGKPKVKNTSIPIKHGIFRFNVLEAEESEVVSKVQPHIISSNRYFNSYSSYVSTFADLKAGDEISVKVSNITLLKYTKDNFFGLNLI